MKHYKTIPKHVEQKIVVASIDCDVCHQPITPDAYDASDKTLEMRIGDCFPEGDNRTTYSLDICAECFLGKVIPLIESNLDVKFSEAD